MKTLDVEQLDSVNVIYHTFFILLNQAILVAMTFLFGIESKLGWFNLPFGIILVMLNLWSFLVWRNEGGVKAFKFYAKANVCCLLLLAAVALALVGLCAG